MKKSLEDNFYRQIRKSIVDVMRKVGVMSARNNVYAYRFIYVGHVCTVHEGSDDDGEYGAGINLLKSLTDNEIKYMMVVVSTWSNEKKLGPRRFTSARSDSVGKNLSTTV